MSDASQVESGGEPGESRGNLQFLSAAARLVVYFGLALAVFFGVAVLIFIVRGEESDYHEMPDVTGRYYVDVHDDLTRRLQLRVSLVKRQFPDQNPGLVLYQSVAPGRRVLPREKVELIVNQPEPLLSMPDLVRTPVASARASLERLTSDEKVYSLELGAVSEIASDEYPDGTVIAQFPLARESVAPGERVYLLVARTPSDENPAPTEVRIDEWVGQNVSILTEYLVMRGIEYRLGEIAPPPSPRENGRVSSVEPGPDGVYKLNVYFQPPAMRYSNGYERAETELEPGACYAEVAPLDDSEEGLLARGPRRIFEARADRPADRAEERVELLFYRSGAEELRVVCGEDVVFEKRYRPERPG